MAYKKNFQKKSFSVDPKTQRYASPVKSGQAKNGSTYSRQYGIDKTGSKWNKTNFTKSSPITKGKNAGGRAVTRTIVRRYSKTSFYGPKR